MPLYGMQTPNGYSWKADPWVNTGDLVNRMNFALVLSGDRMNGVQTDWRGLLGTSELKASVTDENADNAAAAKEQKLEMLLLDQPVSEHTRTTVLQQFKDTTAQRDAAKKFPITANGRAPLARILNAGTPVQRARVTEDHEAEVMAGLLLGSPEFQRR
jgi:hypothetical protein